MNSGWLFDRLYACLLLVSLPLLPAGGDPQHSALSRSSLQLPPVPYVVDLSTRSPDIFSKMQWKTFDDLYGSDHYHMTPSCGVKAAIPSRKLRKADWLSFASETRDWTGSGDKNISSVQVVSPGSCGRSSAGGAGR